MPLRKNLTALLLRRKAPATPGSSLQTGAYGRQVDIRITTDLFDHVRAHVEDITRGEEAGFLLCSVNRLDKVDVLLAREWTPVPQGALRRNASGSALTWSAQFNSSVIERAIAMGATPVLVHSHGTPQPTFSDDDRINERALFSAVSRLVSPAPTGTLLLGNGSATGSFWLRGQNSPTFRRLVILGDTIQTWYAVGYRTARSAGWDRLILQPDFVTFMVGWLAAGSGRFSRGAGGVAARLTIAAGAGCRSLA